ncbi:MAG: DUF1684 domain-containing protein [Trueperaceae bacterium]|nr:DUF1684 domain-containing protein [Trueperaceae bacterium]MCC6309781.1 DUF1684 domain-containing protein [Trueperaceae bacterium]MCO5172787.1 DUF1684 domain-containing protein [Trueperaceae bacterium]
MAGREALTAVERWRAEKDAFLRDHPRSPLRGDAGFDGLAYYPYDPAASVVATLERARSPERVRLATSSGDERAYLEFGRARFVLAGTDVTLTLFASVDEPDGPRLFLPFADATSGGETYGAGRYLDLSLAADAQGEIVLDFNYAYHPYCAYAEGYSCALPPAGNRLSVAVRAGERLPAEAAT